MNLILIRSLFTRSVAVINFKLGIMKYTSLVLMSALLLSVSCETVKEAGNTLTDDERAYLAQQALIKCRADTDKTIEDFQADSAAAIMDFERDNAWKYEYKKDSTVVDTTSVSVWKVSSPNLYLRLNITEDGTTYNKFIKIRVDDNSQMLKTLQTMKCETITTVKSRTVSFGSTTATTTIEDLRINGDEADTFVDASTVYHFNTSLPAYYGFLDRVKTKKTLDEDGKVTKTETFTYAVTKNTNPSAQNDDFTTYSNKKYCMVTIKTVASPNVFDFPYALTCVDDPAVGVDIDGGGADFVPNTELTI